MLYICLTFFHFFFFQDACNQRSTKQVMNSPPPLPPPFDPSKSIQPAWRQAYLWLNQCHVLPPEAIQILSLPTSTIEDLADVLSDGKNKITTYHVIL